jgi:hypothetical protein
VIFADNFATVNRTIWNSRFDGSSVANNQLIQPTNPVVGGPASWVERGPLDFTGCTFTAQLVQACGGGGSTYPSCAMLVGNLQTWQYQKVDWGTEGGYGTWAVEVVPGSCCSSFIPWDVVAPYEPFTNGDWVRMSHDPAGNLMHYQASHDGVTWYELNGPYAGEQAPFPPAAPVNDVYISLSSGNENLLGGPVGNPLPAIWANVSLVCNR